MNVFRWVCLYLLFNFYETRVFYTRRTFRVGPVQNGIVSSSNWQPNRQNTQSNVVIKSDSGSIPQSILQNLPPGSSVQVSKTINVGGPRRTTTRIQVPSDTSLLRTVQKFLSNDSRIFQGPDQFRNTQWSHAAPVDSRIKTGSYPKTFNKSWWSKTVPTSLVPISNIKRNQDSSVSRSKSYPRTFHRTFWSKTVPVGSLSPLNSSSVPNVQNINMTFSNKDFSQFGIPKEWLSNIPPGAHVKITTSSRVIPTGKVTLHSNLPGKTTKRIYTQYKKQRVNNQKWRNRHLPQPVPSVTPGAYCGDTLCEEEKYLLLKHHNRVRRSVNPSASNMRRIIWDIELEKSAESYAKLCRWKHDKTRSMNMPYEYVGQNMHATRGERNVLRATTRWERENINYDIYTGKCIPGKLCGHYTQMVWADTGTVGCGMWKCPFIYNLGWRDSYLVVCNYGPGGNIGGQRPYKIGRKCSDCCETSPNCLDGLCI